MSNIDKQALREAAEKATKGQWVVEFDDEIYSTDGVNNEQIAMVFSENEARDAAFIAAANPDTVLALLDELEAKDRMVAGILNIIIRHTVELGWGEKPITLAELIIYREGSGSDALDAIRAAAAGKGE